MNSQKRAIARIKKATTLAERDYEPEWLVRDILADLRHYCDAKGVDFAEEDRIAHHNYRVELSEDRKNKR